VLLSRVCCCRQEIIRLRLKGIFVLLAGAAIQFRHQDIQEHFEDHPTRELKIPE